MSPEPGGWIFRYTNIHTPYPKTGIFQDDFFTPTSPTNNSMSCNSSCSSVLSEKSLELCTENLGNETGTEIIENSIFSTLGCEVTSLSSEEQTKTTSTQHFGANNKHVSRSFPPPLTTISGTESIQVRPYREDGRLVITAIKTTSLFGQFQAERSHGRLRLSILRECNQTDDDEEEEEGEKEQEEEELEEEEEEEEEEDDDDIINMDNKNGGEEEVVGKNDKRAIEIYKRPKRCKGSRTLVNWEPLLVATS